MWAAAPSPYLPGTPGGPPMTPGITSYLPGTPGGQPMTPGTGALDPTSPAIGMYNFTLGSLGFLLFSVLEACFQCFSLILLVLHHSRLFFG